MMLMHNLAVSEFNTQFYKNLLTIHNLKGGEIKLTKLTFPNGIVDDQANFWGYQFEKDGERFLIPSKDENDETVDVISTLPLFVERDEKVAYQDKVFWLLNEPISAKFSAVKKMNFKEFVSRINSLKHSNPDHRVILTLMALTALTERGFFRACTPPGFGKDSIVDVLRQLIGNCTTIVSPTVAKLQYLHSYDWVAVNEVVDIGRAEWRILEQYLIDASGDKPDIPKHSRSVAGVNEFLDLRSHSLTLFYNDIDCYPEKKQFVEGVAKDALLDRFPPFRFYGHFIEDFNKIKNYNIKKYVEENIDIYKDMIYTYTYYKENINSELKGFKTSLFNAFPERWKTNINRLLRFVDLYSESQDEFDSWCTKIKGCIVDYDNMLTYPKILEEITRTFTSKEKYELKQELRKIDTFTDKIKYLNKYKRKQIKKQEGYW